MPERTVTLSSEMVRALRQHKGQQEMHKRGAAGHYQDSALVFATEPQEGSAWNRPAGSPLLINNLSQRLFLPLIRQAGVPEIRFHNPRHTCATLLIQAGVPEAALRSRTLSPARLTRGVA